MKMTCLRTLLGGVLLGAGLVGPPLAHSHCDTLDGPVIQAARVALDKKDVTPALKWVKQGGEVEVRSVFAKTLIVRALGPTARDLADQLFFETLVRVHRAGEGQPFTGVKPAGANVDPIIMEADQALSMDSVEKVVKRITEDVARGIRQRFARASEMKRHADESVAAGRDFVAAYVEYVHYVESLRQRAEGGSIHHEDVPPAVENAAHAHTR